MLFDTYHRQIKNSFSISKNLPVSKGHSFCKQCLHNLQFMKRYLCRYVLFTKRRDFSVILLDPGLHLHPNEKLYIIYIYGTLEMVLTKNY